MRALRLLSAATVAAFGVASAQACSVLNAPDDVVPGDEDTATSSGSAGGPASTGTEGTTSSSTGTGGAGGGPPADCESPADCDPIECRVAACEAGACVYEDAAAGVDCGPAAAECVGGGRCDGAGTCVAASREGAACSTCDGEPFECVCRAGACEVCGAPAALNLFADPELVGWDLTGGWGLYTRFPRDRQAPTEVPIGKRVLGTDGNRAHPYPGGADALIGGDVEVSSAISPPTELPATLAFLSWHEDEGGGGGRDNKRIVLDVQGIERVLVDCATGEGGPLPFCAPPPGGLVAQRAADAWDPIEIDLPANLVGQVGRIRFEYDTLDANGGRERGWFIDALNAAGRCGCTTDEDCGYLDGPCAEAVCDEASGACTFTPRAGSNGDACGAADEATCSAADSCDAFGLCNTRDAVDSTPCTDCGGSGDCQACGAGACLACMSPVQTFDGAAPTQGWDLDGDWSARASAPASTLPAVVFPTTVFGTSGDGAAEARTIPTAIPETLAFLSWHVDEGGATGTDVKRISIEIDGEEPLVLLDCDAGPHEDLALCLAQPGPRAANAFDPIEIPTGEAAGRVGVIVFSYDDGGSAQTFEQGWYIDDLNAVRCP